MDLKKIHADFNLLWRLIVHFLRKLNPMHEGFGLARFDKNYVHEGLPPIAPSSISIAHYSGQCTVCGECDYVCPLMNTQPRHVFIGPMAMVISGSRASPHFDDLRSSLEMMGSSVCTDCNACSQSCPEGIPILDLSSGMRSQLQVIDQAKSRHAAALPAPSSTGER